MTDGKQSELATNVAVILETCRSIQAQLVKMNGRLEEHEDRIRDLEVWRGGANVRLTVFGVFSAIAGAVAGFFGGK